MRTYLWHQLIAAVVGAGTMFMTGRGRAGGVRRVASA